MIELSLRLMSIDGLILVNWFEADAWRVSCGSQRVNGAELRHSTMLEF